MERFVLILDLATVYFILTMWRARNMGFIQFNSIKLIRKNDEPLP